MDTVMKNTVASRPTAKSSDKKFHIPLAIRFVRWMLPRVEIIAPRYAHNWFVKLFFSPPRYTIPSVERDVLQKAQRSKLYIADVPVEVYTWGSGPAVLLVHGWAGRASQFRSFVPYLTGRGYQVVAFDAPAHGNSKGKRTNIFQFRDVIVQLEKRIGDFHAIVAHSIGGAAAIFALAEGIKTQTVITIATPSIGDEIIHEFALRINGSAKAEEKLKAHILKTFQRPFHELMASHFAQQLNQSIDWLIIHDEHDKEASVQNAQRLYEAYPRATIKITATLGHTRILRDEEVIAACLNFMERKSIY
jgi:pimeloyl-ACP methyl ester carboxylesterase